MNLGELKSAVALKSELTQVDAEKAIKACMAVITEELQKGGTISLTGFGSFTISKRAARTGRNPQTGEPIQIAASNAVSFRAGKNLKEAVNTKPKKGKKNK